MKRNRWFKGQKGFALPMALLLIFVTVSLVVPVIFLMYTTLKLDIVVEEKTVGFNAADAGVQYAIWDFKLEDSVLADQLTVSLPSQVNSNNVMLTANPLGTSGYLTTYLITSEATGPDGKINTVYAEISRLYQANYIFDNAVTAIGDDGITFDISVQGNVSITSTDGSGADIYADGDINFEGKSYEIDDTATIYATGDVSGVPEEQVNDGIAEIDYDIAMSEYDQFIESLIVTQETAEVILPSQILSQGELLIDRPTYINGNVEISGNAVVTITAPVYISGYLQIASNMIHTLSSSIYVGGYYIAPDGSWVSINISGSNLNLDGLALIGYYDVIFSGSYELDAGEEYPLIASVTGDITASGDVELAANLYAPEGQVELGGGIILEGAVFASSVYLSGDVTLIYDPSAGGGDDDGNMPTVTLTKYTNTRDIIQ